MLKQTIRQIALNRRRILSQNKLNNMSMNVKNVLFDNFNFNEIENINYIDWILNK